MKRKQENPLVQVRFAAERDLHLSDGAFRLLCRIVSERAVALASRRWDLDEAFPIPWSKAALWCGIAEAQAYRRLAELEGRYLKADGIQGCPGTAHFFLVTSSIKNDGTRSIKSDGTSSVKNDRPTSIKNDRDHISNSLREEMSSTMRKKLAATPKGTSGEGNGSLRSHEEELNKLRKLREDLRKSHGI